ncbi:unnamed protein product [Arabidopsis lyrata]|nr:unnamed protein product [Arabidopsis lyrata]
MVGVSLCSRVHSYCSEKNGENQVTLNDYFQMNAIADFVSYFRWREVVVIFVDDEYGRNGISVLGDVLAKKRAKISYKAGYN